VIGVSKDRQDVSDRFRAELGLPYPLVGDPQGRILRDYEVRWPLVGLARRVTYIVGRDRRIQQVHRSELDPDSHVSGACSLARRS
jgi:peroxiredoxin